MRDTGIDPLEMASVERFGGSDADDEQLVAQIFDEEAAIILAEGLHHVNGVCYAQSADAFTPRLLEAERRVRARHAAKGRAA